MWFVKYLRGRLDRRLALVSLGPNEARLIYDAALGGIAAISAVVFCRMFLPSEGQRTLLLVPLMPLLLLACNSAVGIYTRLRISRGRAKAIALLASVCCASGIGFLVTGSAAAVSLWAITVYTPLSAARLLLSLPYSRHRTLSSIAVNRRGPVLVIGGAGYIGAHTVELLLNDGQSVRVLDRLMYGRESIAEFTSHRNFELIQGDATDIAKLTLAMKGVSAVVHLAGLVGDPACAVDPEFTRHTNIVATRMAKDVAQAMGVYRFVFASSCSVYGVSEKEVSETDELNPVSLYAQTKIDSERELLSSGRDDFFVTILRFATVFGHSRRPRFDLVANLFTGQAMTDGLITVVGPNQWRPFIHVRDLARAIVITLKAPAPLVQGQIFNVGDKRLNLTILQVAEKVRDVCSRFREVSISVKDDLQDRRTYAVSFQKIYSRLGFEAATLIDPGVEEMAAAFQTGQFVHYREQIYSNVAMTAKALAQFQDPFESSRLYAPLKTS